MTETDISKRAMLTFSQAEGLEPLPAPLKLGEVSQELRAYLWKDFFEHVRSFHERYDLSRLAFPWRDILYDFHVYFLHKPADEYIGAVDVQCALLRNLIYTLPFNRLFDTLQFILRHRYTPSPLLTHVTQSFELARAAYVVVKEGPTIMPAATPEEAAAVSGAFVDLAAAEFGGARSHLRKAGEALNAGNYADCVREAIHAVESVAKTIAGAEKDTLEGALKRISVAHELHTAFREGLRKLYAYTNDEKGVRHALMDTPSRVDAADAQFMLGACAAFVSYLVARSRG